MKVYNPEQDAGNYQINGYVKFLKKYPLSDLILRGQELKLDENDFDLNGRLTEKGRDITIKFIEDSAEASALFSSYLICRTRFDKY